MHFNVLTTALMLAGITLAANNVAQHVVYHAPGANDIVGNKFGCVNITPKGHSSQLGCIKHVFTDGFTVGITDNKSKNKTTCSISGTEGACGPAGVSVTVDITTGTGIAPPPSGPGGTTNLTAADLVNTPIARRTVKPIRFSA